MPSSTAEFGIRQDLYADDRLAAVVNIDPDFSRMVTLIRRDRRYAMADLSAEELRAALSGSSPEEFVARFRQGEFTEIGRRRVDGTLAAGIETRADELWGGAFTNGEPRRWAGPARARTGRTREDGYRAGGVAQAARTTRTTRSDRRFNVRNTPFWSRSRA